MKTKIKIIKVDKLLNEIKAAKKLQKSKKSLEESRNRFYEVLENYPKLDINNWDLLDGRTSIGKPVKKIAKLVDFAMYIIACASLTIFIVYLFEQWII